MVDGWFQILLHKNKKKKKENHKKSQKKQKNPKVKEMRANATYSGREE